MLTKDLKDLICPDKRMKVAASSEAMIQFVKFLYGFELEDDLSEGTLKELVQIGGVYDEHLQKAATDLLKSHLTKENVFQMLKFFKQAKVDVAEKNCKTFIFDNFESQELLTILEDHQEICLDIWKSSIEKSSNCSYTRYTLQIKTDSTIFITGIGLFISPCPGSDIDVTIKISGSRIINSDDTIYEGNIQNLGPSDIVNLDFNKPVEVTHGNWRTISVTCKGSGVACVSNFSGERTVEGKNKNDDFVRRVKFEIDTNAHNISNIFFFVE